MAIATADMKHGMTVTTHSGEWEVLDKHPLAGNWWLHRWNAGVWETDYCHERGMDAVSELSPVVTDAAKWGRAPFNICKDGKPVRQMGYALGKWGVDNREIFGWTVTYLPTGLSVPIHTMVGYRPTIAEVRGVVEMLASHDFPVLDSLAFGEVPTEQHRPELERLKALLTPALQAA